MLNAPPGSGPPGGPPPGNGPGMAAPAGPPAGPPPGSPPVPPAGPGQGASLTGTLAPPFADLSIHLPNHYQLLDLSASTIEQALNTGGFSDDPKNQAAVKSIHHQLTQVIANKAREGQITASVPREADEPSSGDSSAEEEEQSGDES